MLRAYSRPLNSETMSLALGSPWGQPWCESLSLRMTTAAETREMPGPNGPKIHDTGISTKPGGILVGYHAAGPETVASKKTKGLP